MSTGGAASRLARLRLRGARRTYGLRSVFTKSLRDSRRGALIVTAWIVLLFLISGAFVSSSWGDAQTRLEGVEVTTSLPPIFTGLYGGSAPNVDTLGGFTSWRYGILFFLAPALWSVLWLSKSLTAEARRGSLELVAAAPLSRRRLALERLGGHAAALFIAMLVVAVVAWGVGEIFATLPGDEIPLTAALAHAALMLLVALAGGTIAFALAPFAGRGAAAGIAGALMVGSWLIQGYRESITVFDWLTPISWFSWTAGHRPIAGTYDWLSLLPLAGIALVATMVGVVVFERRDLGQTGSFRLLRLPRVLLGTGGPLQRSWGERLSTATAWGLGIGVYAFIVSTGAADLREVIRDTPSLAEVMEAALPTLDLDQPGFALQLLFVQIGTLLIGLAAWALIGGWASDETEGRLELLLTTPVRRTRWLVLTALGAYLAIAVTALITALATALGVGLSGEDPLTPMSGALVLVLHGSAMAGFGVAVGGLWRPSAAGPTVALVVIGSLTIDILVPALDLPAWVRDLALSSHYGEPMVGNWDPVGVVVALALAIGGLAVGAWGFSRRDLQS